MPPDSRTPAPDSTIGPAHSALVLSDTTENPVEPTLSRSVVRSAARARLAQFEAAARHFPAAPVGSTSQATQTPQSPSPPLHTYLPFLPPRRSWFESQISRRQLADSDDPATTLGRRVAARTETRHSSVPNRSVPLVEQNVLSRTHEIAHDLEGVSRHLAAALQQAEAEIPLDMSPPGIQFSPITRNAGTRSPEIRDVNRNVFLRRVRPPPPDRQATFFPSVRRFSRDETRRSGRMRAELAIPPARTEPPSDVERWNSSPSVSADPSTSREQEVSTLRHSEYQNSRERSLYSIRRILDEHGEERIHGINTENWDDGSGMDWLLPQSMQVEGSSRQVMPLPASETSTTHSQRRASLGGEMAGISQPGHSGHPLSFPRSGRRRGWARLDRDGNEIPTDEEEEFERARTQSRVQAQRQGRTTLTLSPQPNAPPIAMGGNRLETFMPTTRSSIMQSSDDERGAIARVRINPLQNKDASDDDEDSCEAVIRSLRLRHPRESIDPLPMPLAAMMPRAKRAKRDTLSGPPMLLPEHASLAGR